MVFNFKKIASVVSSGLMMSATLALAAAANYPAPFVQSGNADVAIVVGESAAFSDNSAATALSTDLATVFAAQGGRSTGSTTITGENFPLFTGSSELFLNATLNSVRATITSNELPTVLADDTFEGTSSVQYTQKIVIGDNPKITFDEMPTSSDDPVIGVSFSTNPSTTPLYNATVTFGENVNFTHADSVGENIKLFGQEFTVGAATTASKLVLLKSSESVDLSSDTAPSASVTVDGAEYTIELIAATDTSATIKVTNSAGVSDTKEISESASKKIMGVEVSVDRADENNFRLTSTVSIGSNRITLQDGSAVKVGSDEDIIEGTQAEFYLASGTGTTLTNIGRLDVQAAAGDSDEDAIFPGGAFVDPVFGSFKIDFNGVSTPLDNTEDREIIKVSPSGNDKMNINFRSSSASEAKTVTWAYNKTTAEGVTTGSGLGGMILADSDGDAIRTVELTNVNKSQYVVIANDKDGGGLYEVVSIYNSSDAARPTDDYITLKNVFTGDQADYSATTEGTITATVEGKTMTITYSGASTVAQELRQARFNTPETSTATQLLMFPTILTSKGAKVAFYQPTRLNFSMANYGGAAPTNVTSISFPDGDGFTSFALADGQSAADDNWTIGGNLFNASNVNSGASVTVGKLTYNFTGLGAVGANLAGTAANVYLVSPEGGNIVRPALIIFEERDDSTNYEAAIVTLDGGYDGGNNDIGVTDIVRTYGSDSASLGNEIQLESDRDVYQDMDFWGTLFSLDKSDTDQISAEISYPDDQIESMVYVAEAEATDTSASGALGNIVVTDSQVATVSSKNLVVVGGSCINKAAAKLLTGSDTAVCGADFTTRTGVGSGSYLIQSFTSPWASSKIAVLVAGYTADDTTNAATALRTQKPDVAVNKKYTGSTATTLTPVTA
ncbi:MAG: hypothetical protein AABY02_00070 [Nanoarchaeota archaeon]